MGSILDEDNEGIDGMGSRVTMMGCRLLTAMDYDEDNGGTMMNDTWIR